MSGSPRETIGSFAILANLLVTTSGGSVRALRVHRLIDFLCGEFDAMRSTIANGVRV